MAVPWANLQQYPPYLPRAEGDGEPVVLPFLFLFQDCMSLQAGALAMRSRHVRCKLIQCGTAPGLSCQKPPAAPGRVLPGKAQVSLVEGTEEEVTSRSLVA